MELLREHHEGLIAMSACLQGKVPQLMLAGRDDLAEAAAREFAQIMGENNFFIELQDAGLPEQKKVNPSLIDLARRLGLGLVATNDCHYLRRKDHEAHDVLLCIQTGKTVEAADRIKLSGEIYFKSPEEMADLFPELPETISNCADIAARCNMEIPLGQLRFPVFHLDNGETAEDRLRKVSWEGLDKRLKEIEQRGLAFDRQEYKDRLEYELDVLCKMGFPGYFLVVADFINWAKDHGIPVGPGRGSAAGSLVAYSMRITDLDPIRYKLIFERFLNIERKSMPDIDVDFCYNRRGEVIEYVTQKYGADHVSQIITYGTMQARAVLRDVGRAMNIPYNEVDQIAKLVPAKLGISLDEGPGLRAPPGGAHEGRPPGAKAPRHRPPVGGPAPPRLHPRRRGGHRRRAPGPGGSPVPGHRRGKRHPVRHEVRGKGRADQVRLFGSQDPDGHRPGRGDGAGQPRSQVSPSRTSTWKNQATFELLSPGRHHRRVPAGVLGHEGAVWPSCAPRCSRTSSPWWPCTGPGPLESGMVDDFVARKHGTKKVSYDLPQLEPVLKETYGVIVYQEQVMEIAMRLAGYSLGEGDILRRAMGKKDPQVMSQQKERFLEGALEKGIPRDKSGALFDLIEKFAGYGFNKSHSAAYALIAYQTAFLKAHYPLEFMAALLTSEVNDTDKVMAHIGECRERGLTVLPPDINHSGIGFTVADNAIRFGLAAVKNVGRGAVEAIIAAREEGGEFSGLHDMCERLDLRKVNRRVLESLIKCGAFDSTGAHRAQLMAVLDEALEHGQKVQGDKENGQEDLFRQEETPAPELPNVPFWSESDRLSYEKEAIGFLHYRPPAHRLPGRDQAHGHPGHGEPQGGQ